MSAGRRAARGAGRIMIVVDTKIVAGIRTCWFEARALAATYHYGSGKRRSNRNCLCNLPGRGEKRTAGLLPALGALTLFERRCFESSGLAAAAALAVRFWTRILPVKNGTFYFSTLAQ